jgi:hypothetical protein
LNNSNNWDNLTGALSANTGITANGFGIYVFSIFGSLGAKGLINIQFGDPLPGGTFVLGYAQTSTTKKNDTVMKIFSTPFTESGLTVPEPGTLALMLFGSGLVGAAGVLRRRFF